jgi:branched-chain amino acid transport system permease protein
MYTSYANENQIFSTGTQKVVAGITIAILVLMPFNLPVINQIPFVRFLGDGDWLRPVSTVLVYLVAALGLNILVGMAGQVSLGHAFFMGVGA